MAPESQEATQVQESATLNAMVAQLTPEMRPRAIMRGVQPTNLEDSQYLNVGKLLCMMKRRGKHTS
jgi:hypothetical protein